LRDPARDLRGRGRPTVRHAGDAADVRVRPESFITYPPKPANPKQAWNPEWSVRLRTRSTASAILGLDMGGMQNQDDDDQQQPQQQQQRRGMRGLLNGILGG